MTISVFKFGGSCLQNAEAFDKIGEIMDLHKNEKMVFVASALKGITDKLVETAHHAADKNAVSENLDYIKKRHFDIIRALFSNEVKRGAMNFIKNKLKELKAVLGEIVEFGPEAYFMDYILSFGEKMSTYLLYLYVKNRGVPAKYVTGEEIIITDSNFGNSLPIWDLTANRIKKLMVPVLDDPEDKTIFCVTGFIGRNKIGYTTTLGRGGSDFTATIIARTLYDHCKDKNIRVVLWKDVGGILATNPKYAEKPKLIRKLNYDEAKEMAFYGAKILHPKCLFGLDERHIPVEIRKFEDPLSEDYSVIGDESGPDEVTGISTIENVALITVSSGSLVSTPGVLAKIFSIMGDNGINVSLVAQSSSEVNTTFIVDSADGERAFRLISEDEFFSGWAEVKKKDVAILAVTGKGIYKASVQSKIFGALTEAGINPIAIAQPSDGLNLSMVLDRQYLAKAVKMLNACIKDM